MVGAVDRGRQARSLIERLGARIPGFSGYLNRELRREVDELLRRHVADRIDAARREVAGVMGRLGVQQSERLGCLNRIVTQLDGLAQRLRAAGAGYAGLFAAFKVREEQLERLYELDLSLAEDVEALVSAASHRQEGWEAEVERLAERLRLTAEARPQAVAGLLDDGRSS